MPFISVYEDDVMRCVVELDPDVWEAAQREVTEEELAELRILEASRQTLQAKLRAIRARPEVDRFEEL